MTGTLEDEPGLDLTRRREGAEPQGPEEGSREGPGVGVDGGGEGLLRGQSRAFAERTWR